METTLTLCKTPDCGKPTTGKSKYCAEHAAIARAQWKANISADADARKDRYTHYAKVWADAVAAGKAAGDGHRPEPMYVTEGDLLGRPRPGAPVECVPDGVCGFAWVSVRPGTTSFARWLVKNAGARKDYYGGVSVWIGGWNQSYERKMAAAQAMADVLNRDLGEPKVGIYASGRLD